MVHFTISVGWVHLRRRAADIYLTCSHCALGNMYQYSPHFSEFDEHTIFFVANNNVVKNYNKNAVLLFDFTKNLTVVSRL